MPRPAEAWEETAGIHVRHQPGDDFHGRGEAWPCKPWEGLPCGHAGRNSMSKAARNEVVAAHHNDLGQESTGNLPVNLLIQDW
jgi:hypothetical protein